MTEDFTDFDYRVRVRIGDDSGRVEVLVTSLDGQPATPSLPVSFASPDLDDSLARRIGSVIVTDARREHYNNEPEDDEATGLLLRRVESELKRLEALSGIPADPQLILDIRKAVAK